MARFETSMVLQKFLTRYALKHNAKFTVRRIIDKCYPRIMQHTQKLIARKIDPFQLCPPTIIFWLIVPPFNAIGVSIEGLRRIAIDWRQQLEPNQTVYLDFKLLAFNSPFALTLLVTFALFAITIVDGAYRVVQAIKLESENRLKRFGESIDNFSDVPTALKATIKEFVDEEKSKNTVSSLEPFNLTPRMSVFFPVNDNHTSIGFLTIDFRHVEISVKQSLDPNDTIISLIRFLDLYSPFPLQIAAMLLSLGLFINGKIYELEQEPLSHN